MARCPLCKTAYPDGVSVCKIDGTRLAGDRTASVALPSLEARADATQGLRESDLQSVVPKASGKGARIGGGLASMTDEVTTAAKPEALAARARGHESGTEEPPRIATGSGTVAPKNKKKDAWSAPFLDAAPVGLDSQNSEEWVGKTLGSYKLLSILGKGGMGCVYRAEHTKLGREVALKVLRSDYAKRRDAVARFFQEARSVNKVRHRNIVDITDLVELDEGIVFIIMEYLEGVNLTKIMRAKGDVDPVRTLGILVQICDGLAAAHSVGIVHRDLKPDNIIVAKEGDNDLVKLLDFGVAKLLDKDEDDDIGLMTVAGSVVGTPAFMSPEQAGGLQVDGRADLYSLGAIMYEMFTKQQLFKGKSFGEYVRMHLNEKPVPPSKTPGGKNIDPRVEETIMMCLEKSPDARFQTAQEMRAELLSLLSTFESSGELTAHLAKHQQDAKPVGEASPKPGAKVSYPPQASPLRKQAPAAEVPDFYKINSDASAERPNEQVLVSRSSEAMAPGYTPVNATPLNGTPQTGPMRPFQSNLGYTPGSAMASYASDPHMRFPTAGHTSVRAPQPRNYRGVAIAAAVALAGAVVLVVTSSEGTSKQEATKAAETPAQAGPTSADLNAAELEPSVAPVAGVAAEDSKAKQNIASTQRIISVALSSEPSAQVFAVGAVSPVCAQTPCDLRIDTSDGGSASRRDYILRTADHQDSTITINLRAPRERIFVTLDPVKKTREPAVITTVKKPPERTVPRTEKNTKRPANKAEKNVKKPKCKVGAQDTFNPFGEDAPCE